MDIINNIVDGFTGFADVVNGLMQFIVDFYNNLKSTRIYLESLPDNTTLPINVVFGTIRFLVGDTIYQIIISLLIIGICISIFYLIDIILSNILNVKKGGLTSMMNKL
jgi:hypothetical protein